METELPVGWKFLTIKKLEPTNVSKALMIFKNPVNNSRTEDFSAKLKNNYPSDEEIETTKKY